MERNKDSQFKAPLTDVSIRTALEIAFKFWEAILHRSRPGLLKYKLLSNSTHKSFFQTIGYLLLNFVLIVEYLQTSCLGKSLCQVLPL